MTMFRRLWIISGSCSCRVEIFFYTMQVDESSRVKDIFWAHASSRLNYEHFGDVVTFDTTYRTNRYNMPFGIYFQTCVFGCVLLREETIESFKWLFNKFTKATNGKEPKSILTGKHIHLCCKCVYFS